LVSYSRGVLQEKWDTLSLLLMTEIAKLVISLIGIFLGYGGDGTMTISEVLINDVKTSLPMSIPGILYLIQNSLGMYALGTIDATTFTLITQNKLISTALFSRFMLDKRFPYSRIRSLILVAVVAFQVSYSTMPHSDPCLQEEVSEADVNTSAILFRTWLMGVSAAFISSSCSGFSTVFMEKKFKGSPTLSVWDRNLQLATCSIVLYLIIIWLFTDISFTPSSFFNGWSWLIVLLTIIGAAGGILIALCLKYADSIIKTFAATGSILLTAFLSYYLLSGPMNCYIAVAAVVVTFSVLNYQLDPN